jgi:hypothetical protein
VLRAQCEAREAAYLLSDPRIALRGGDGAAATAATRLRELDELAAGRHWRRGDRRHRPDATVPMRDPGH